MIRPVLRPLNDPFGSSLRIGNSYAINRLVPGRPLILGGQQLEHAARLGLDGHSDEDVLVHAIIDALLGALSLGDIGKYPRPLVIHNGKNEFCFNVSMAILMSETLRGQEQHLSLPW